jgi:hypothetical protein
MDCKRYEAELAAALTAPEESADREERLAALREHASGCEECRGSLALLDWLAIPPGERDRSEEPAEAYWESFDSRLKARIRREEAAAATRRRTWIAVAASLAVVALVSAWALRPDRGRIAAVDDLPEPLAERLAAADPGAMQHDLAMLVGSEGVADEGALDFLAGFEDRAGSDLEEDSDEAGWVFPSTRGLDPEARQRLLDWLAAEEARLEGGSA